MQEKAEKFWTWFSQNSRYYTKLDDLDDKERDRLLDDLMDRLQEVNSEFFFEIGGGTRVLMNSQWSLPETRISTLRQKGL